MILVWRHHELVLQRNFLLYRFQVVNFDVNRLAERFVELEDDLLFWFGKTSNIYLLCKIRSMEGENFFLKTNCVQLLYLIWVWVMTMRPTWQFSGASFHFWARYLGTLTSHTLFVPLLQSTFIGWIEFWMMAAFDESVGGVAAAPPAEPLVVAILYFQTNQTKKKTIAIDFLR